MVIKSDERKPDALRVLFYVVLLGIIVYTGRPLLIPLSYAILISFILFPICQWLENKGAPRFVAILLGLLMVTTLLLALLYVFYRQIEGLIEEWPFIQARFTAMSESFSDFVNQKLNIPVSKQKEYLGAIFSSNLSGLVPALKSFLYNSAINLVLLILIPFFVALILYHREHFARTLVGFFPESQKETIYLILKETVVTFYNFIKGMALVYLIVAILNILALLALGIPHAVLFGIVASVLTFIPYIGITIGSLLPVTMGWIMYDSIWHSAGVIAAFTFIQYLEANLIFPLAVSYRLNVNTLFTLLAIIAGGLFWGTSGMILFVPFTAIIKLIAEKTERWRWLSEMLGTSGNPVARKD